MESKNEINRLFQKFINKTISAEELKMFYKHIRQSENDQEIEGLLTQLWDYLDLAENQKSAPLSGESSDQMERKIRLLKELAKHNEKRRDEIESAIEKINKEYDQPEHRKKKSGWLDWFKRFFVVLIVAIGAGIWYYLSDRDAATATEITYVEKVSELGSKSMVTLSDGSQVKLNAGSKLIFPKLFEGGTREVILEGEAYFQVAHDEKKPFVVRSGQLVTTVLGTSFNVKAYPTEDIAVTVATGKVRVAKAQEGDLSGEKDQGAKSAPLILTPNEQAVYSLTGGNIHKQQVAAEEYTGWSKGILRFDNVRLEEAIVRLSRWYGVDFQFENEGIKECLIVAEYDNATLVTVLENLKFVLGITYQFTENGVLVNGNGCSMSN